MKKKLSLLALTTSLMAGNAFALSFVGKIEFLTPLVLTEVQALDVGKFASSGAPGTASSGGTSSGGVSILQQGHNAIFSVAGSQDQTVDINVSDSSTFSNGVDSLDVSFQAPANVVLTGGSEEFGVSATVDVPGAISPGEYTGIYNVDVIYQ
jgi:hypothetical protein